MVQGLLGRGMSSHPPEETGREALAFDVAKVSEH